jgi:O-antigen/teichoic acid export membrane protein
MTQSRFNLAVSHSVYSFIGTASTFAISFLFAGFTIRYLGNDRAGYFITLSAILSLSQISGGLGIGNPALRRMSELYAKGERTPGRHVAGSVLLVNLTVGALASACCLALFPQIFVWSKLPVGYRSEALWGTVFTAVCFVVDQAGSSYRLVYPACQRQDMKNLSMSCVGFVGGIIRILCLKWFPNMAAASLAGLGVSVCWLMLDVNLTKRLLGGWVVPTWAWREIRPMFHFSMWENVQAIGIYATTTADKVILTSFLGSGALPYYAIAQRFFTQIHSAVAQQFSFMFPLLAASGDDVFEIVAKIQDRARWFLAAIGALLYAGLFQVGPHVLSLLISPGFAERARWPVYLVCVQGMFFAFGIANFFLLYSVGSGSRNALFNVGNGVGICLLAWVLIPHYGYVGASIAQLLIVASVSLYVIESRRILRIQVSLLDYLSAYLSPLCLFVVSVTASLLLRNWADGSLGALLLATIVTVLTGVACLLVIEQTVFRERRRLATVYDAARILTERFTQA